MQHGDKFKKNAGWYALSLSAIEVAAFEMKFPDTWQNIVDWQWVIDVDFMWNLLY